MSEQRNETALLFAHIADAIRKVGDEHGCKVYVSTNSRSITIDRQRPGRGEYDLHVKVRGDGA